MVSFFQGLVTSTTLDHHPISLESGYDGRRPTTRILNFSVSLRSGGSPFPSMIDMVLAFPRNSKPSRRKFSSGTKRCLGGLIGERMISWRRSKL